MNVVVAHSRVADGSMLNRENGRDETVFSHRVAWLNRAKFNPERTYRLCLTYEGNEDFCRYREVNASDVPVTEFDAANEDCDALVTTTPGVGLFLPLADCIGAVFFDETHNVLMMSHLGRHSLEQNGGVRSVQYLTEKYGTDPSKLKVWLSAAVGKDSYKIYALNHKGMKEAVYEQLKTAGILFEHIEDNTDETDIHDDYYSHSQYLKGNAPENGRHAFAAVMVA